ncbi:unnamed protein product [Brassica napus]|uniref:(rape) hypothetical protein n=1 Tax=Brassica napus TaxID=3708 RepID=A0A817AG08_BRANA|nr:unnamed protein product [Brassica napus]
MTKLLLLLGALILSSVGYVRSDASDHRYKEGDIVPLYANKVGPFHNPSETYRYFDLPFCVPEGVKEKKEALGEVLNGDRLVSAPYKLNFREEKDSEVYCKKKLSKEEVRKFRQAVEKDYYFQMYYDDLPIWGFIGKVDKEIKSDPSEYKYFLYKHIEFEILYNNDRVIEISARMDPHSLVDLTEDKEVDAEFMYTVKWKETETPFEKRMDKYSMSSSLPHHLEIHWFSIINSCVTVLLLTGFLATILMRVLKNDFTKYAQDEEAADDLEETGWKYIHGDVFRFPTRNSLFAASLGSGTQLFTLTIFIFMLALVGVFYPYNRGALFTALVVIYALTSGIAGYTSASFYCQLEGKSWIIPMRWVDRFVYLRLLLILLLRTIRHVWIHANIVLLRVHGLHLLRVLLNARDCRLPRCTFLRSSHLPVYQMRKMLSSMQILPLEAPPTDGNLGPLPPSQLTDQEIEERELQSEQKSSNQAPESVATHTRTIGIIHPPPDIRSIVEKTAQFVSKNGLEFEKRIMASNAKNAKFNFLTSSDPYHAFYQHKLAEYRAQNEDGAQGSDADGADLQVDGGGDEGEAGEAQPDLQAQFRVPPKPLEPPEPEKYTVRLPEGITGEELEYIKLTAQFVARNGKSFLTGLQSRENNNPQFYFMKPTHSMFPLFTALVDAYFDVLKPPEDLKEKLRKSAADLTTVLERCLHRLEWDRSQEQQRKKEEDEKEQERVQMAMIDWHDFVVVESIDFADDEDEELPPPMTLEEVIRRSKVSAAMEEDDVVEPGKEVEMEMDEEEMKLVADGMRAANLEENGGYVKIDNMNEEAPMRIVKNWKRPEDRIPTERDPTKVVISPITGELIPINEMSEHMRISLIDPKFKEQKDRMFAKIRETTLAQDDEIAKNIVGLARLRPDIFGTTEEEVSNAVKAEIEKKKDEQPSQVIWDGHTGSIGRTANQALAQNANGEEQGNGVYGDPNSFPGPAALPPPRLGVPVVRPLPPPPNLALNLPRPPPSVQYPGPPRPLGVPMMQGMHPQHQLSMPGQPGHPSMMMMNRPPQMQAACTTSYGDDATTTYAWDASSSTPWGSTTASS